jgi:hypothetical protein
MMDKIKPFEEFEHAVMQQLLEEETLINRLLREQYKKARVVKREFTGVGFFTNFEIPNNVLRITEPVERGYGNVICDINGIKDFGGFVLFIEKGVMTCLEGYTFYDEWPVVITSYNLHHD